MPMGEGSEGSGTRARVGGPNAAFVIGTEVAEGHTQSRGPSRRDKWGASPSSPHASADTGIPAWAADCYSESLGKAPSFLQ